MNDVNVACEIHFFYVDRAATHQERCRPSQHSDPSALRALRRSSSEPSASTKRSSVAARRRCSAARARQPFTQPLAPSLSPPTRPRRAQCLFPVDEPDVGHYTLRFDDPQYGVFHRLWGSGCPTLTLANDEYLREEAGATAAGSTRRAPSTAGRAGALAQQHIPDHNPAFNFSTQPPALPDASPALFPAAMPLQNTSSDDGSAPFAAPAWVLGSPAHFPATLTRHDSCASSRGSSDWGSPNKALPLLPPALHAALPPALPAGSLLTSSESGLANSDTGPDGEDSLCREQRPSGAATPRLSGAGTPMETGSSCSSSCPNSAELWGSGGSLSGSPAFGSSLAALAMLEPLPAAAGCEGAAAGFELPAPTGPAMEAAAHGACLLAGAHGAAGQEPGLSARAKSPLLDLMQAGSKQSLGEAGS